MEMNAFENKDFLARIRGGDFAHPGEEAAIDLALMYLSAGPDDVVLDAGCGRGATADAIRERTGAKVMGVDLDERSIAYANDTYPGVCFAAGDITKLSSLDLGKADVIYAFNSIYAVPDLEACFAAFGSVANTGARAGIFDYIAYDADLLAKTGCLPESVHSMAEMMQIPMEQGWVCTGIVNLDLEYMDWYRRFLVTMDAKREALVAARSEEVFKAVQEKYETMLCCLESGVLGGGLHIYTYAA